MSGYHNIPYDEPIPPICGHCDKEIDGDVLTIRECCDGPICEDCFALNERAEQVITEMGEAS